ncbi:MAG TPA: hypothetical protein VKR55_14895 [Bradyrhizobium sp.]|uniref:hypothetical protein n=1 Tax=Bradyrhizobium sp. TaxID=376 RepID=UPI002C4F1AAD|nr:hypothetical protein [Bradyrhizobium sp.]HLZ03424.1 hypothetical protein [Bradyrhizobium sp.]
MPTPTQGPDAELLAMIQRHDQAWSRWGQLAKENEDDPRIDALSDECGKLEPLIVATPASTAEGLTGKRRIVAKVGYAGINGNPGLACGDLGELVEAILMLDADRIAAAG